MPTNSENSATTKGVANPSKSPNGSSGVAHEWRWHATGAGMGWVCDGPCDGHYRFTSDEDLPPKYGCISDGGNAGTGDAASRSETGLPSPIFEQNKALNK